MSSTSRMMQALGGRPNVTSIPSQEESKRVIPEEQLPLESAEPNMSQALYNILTPGPSKKKQPGSA